MTLKSYLLLSGGGTLIATYLVTLQPQVSPRPAATARVATRTSTPGVDIRQEADRLQTRVRQEVEFSSPSRNLFRFGERPKAASVPTVRVPVETAPAPAPAEVAPPPPPIQLSGISTQDGQRKAYLITTQGVLEVQEGAAVPPDYRVGRIEEDAVELTAGDGTTRRLKLRP